MRCLWRLQLLWVNPSPNNVLSFFALMSHKVSAKALGEELYKLCAKRGFALANIHQHLCFYLLFSFFLRYVKKTISSQLSQEKISFTPQSQKLCVSYVMKMSTPTTHPLLVLLPCKWAYPPSHLLLNFLHPGIPITVHFCVINCNSHFSFYSYFSYTLIVRFLNGQFVSTCQMVWFSNGPVFRCHF